MLYAYSISISTLMSLHLFIFPILYLIASLYTLLYILFMIFSHSYSVFHVSMTLSTHSYTLLTFYLSHLNSNASTLCSHLQPMITSHTPILYIFIGNSMPLHYRYTYTDLLLSLMIPRRSLTILLLLNPSWI